MPENLHNLINYSEAVFWDFDGVIKDSVEVKSIAFEKLFSIYGHQISTKVREHHEQNIGISRFEKIPLYMSWSDELITDKSVQEFCNKFSLLVKRAVIDSPWVPGFLEVIESAHCSSKHILVTSTPEEEIEYILDKLGIASFFYKVYGSPVLKKDAIFIELRNLSIKSENAILIGDSLNDYEAARSNNLKFFLRCTDFNKNLQKFCKDNTFKDFLNE
jgi:phosphoglycolate phosphatase-like HAD superfamily hydrolase